jgi:putative peptide zinc metalloprotease protein
MLTRPAVIAWLLTVLAAIGLVAVHSDTLQSRLPDFRSFFTAENLLWLAVSMAVVKVLHELGHAVACKHFGAECHDLGLMFLVLTPCLYCDVSDAWMLPNKWRRIAVSAAGLYVEIFLAAVCTFLWWFSEPGLLNSLCLNTMFVCSVSTLVFNGNPLMRFDGYYIFSDLVEIPNLQSRARSAASRLLTSWTLGIDLPGERAFTQERQALLAVYAVAATCYRWLVVIGCFVFLNAVLKPYRLELLAQAFMLVTLLGIVAGPAWNLTRFFRNPIMRRQIQRGRLSRSVLLAFLVGAALVLLPIPCRVRAPVLLQPQDARYVYVAAPGTLQATVAAGQSVQPGDVLARLTDRAIEQEQATLASEREQQHLHVRYLESRRGQDAEAAAQIPAARKRLAELDDQLQQVRRRQELLTLVAPVAGTVIAPPRRTARPPAPGRLPQWSGTPLDPENRGSHVEAGTLLCLIGDPDRLQGVALIDQSDVEFVRLGQRVSLLLNQLPSQPLLGTITDIAKIDLQTAPPQLAAVGGLAAQQDEYGVPHPITTAYQARIALDDHTWKLATGAPGHCKITVAPQPLGERLLRYLSRTFTFKL